MTPKLLSMLSCPYCEGTLDCSSVCSRAEDDVQYGVLSCTRCTLRYPVVAGIPIMRRETERVDAKAQTSDRTSFFGPRVLHLVELLESNQPEKAFQCLVTPSSPRFRFPLLPRALRNSSFQRVLRCMEAGIGVIAFPVWRNRAVRRLLEMDTSTTAADFLRFYYGGAYRSEMLNYFLYRFGQPRHLAALTLANLFHREEGPILDLACGIGHLTHYLAQGCCASAVIGLDRNFLQLLIAKEFVAPDAEYVCCEADWPLPFSTDSFSGLLCSDAFHYFQRTIGCVREMERVAKPDGVTVITRVANAMLEPHEGYELTPDGYRSLFAKGQVMLLDEDALLARYLRKLGPKLDVAVSEEDLESQKWLSAVVSSRTDVFRDHGPFDDWPHATGRLRINPLYREEAVDDHGDRVMRFHFPSKWYESEDRSYRKYAPDVVTIPRNVLEHLDRDEDSELIEDLLGQCVLIGMPERYI